MNYQLEHRGAVAAFRCMCVVVVGTGSRVGLSEEVYRLTLQYILMDGVEVRLVNGKDKGMDAVATIRSLYGITVDAGSREVFTLIEVRTTLADRYTSRVECLLVDAELEAEEAFSAVDGGIVAVGTCSVVCLLVIAPAVVPEERQGSSSPFRRTIPSDLAVHPHGWC